MRASRGGSPRRARGRGHGRPEAGDEVWLAGRHLLRETLAAGVWPLQQVLVEAGDAELDELAALARERGISVERAPREALDERAGGHGRHQGITALAGEFPYADLELAIAGARAEGRDPFVLLLDQLHDPHNVGAILRSADGAGVDCVVITERRQVGVTAVVARTSAGAVNWVPIAQVTNLAGTIERLRKLEIWIYGASEKAERTIYDTDLTGPVAIVVGGEGTGLRQLTGKRCDEMLSIPLGGKVGSLNASVAAGVVLFEAVRQRRRPR